MKPIPSLLKRRILSTRFFVFCILSFSLGTMLNAQTQNTSKVYMSTDRPHALALIGDRYHSSVHIRNGLMGALALENIPVVYIENHEALTAEALKDIDLLIFFKDGNIWPNNMA